MLLNLVIPFSACGDVRVLPSGNQTLVFQNGEVIFQALSEFLVLVGVRVKHLDGRGIGVVFECGHRSPSRLGLREDTYPTTTTLEFKAMAELRSVGQPRTCPELSEEAAVPACSVLVR